MGIGPPRVLRSFIQTLSLLAIAVCLAAPAAQAAPTRAGQAPATVFAVKLTATESAFARAINKVRRAHGVGPLRINNDLVLAARSHSKDMIERGYLGHGAVARRLARFGITNGTRGENLGWADSYESVVSVIVAAWLGSPMHRMVLLSPRFHAVGVGIRVGPFEGCDRAVVVTTDFWSG